MNVCCGVIRSICDTDSIIDRDGDWIVDSNTDSIIAGDTDSIVGTGL